MKSEKKSILFLKNILFIKRNFQEIIYKLFCGELYGSPFVHLKTTKRKIFIVHNKQKQRQTFSEYVRGVNFWSKTPIVQSAQMPR